MVLCLSVVSGFLFPQVVDFPGCRILLLFYCLFSSVLFRAESYSL
jgi:hypothetical protein